MKRLLLIDGFNHVFRAYHAMQRIQLETFDGTPTGAIYGFFNTINHLKNVIDFSSIAVVFDSPGKNFRHTIYPQYKANRGPMPDDLVPQIEPIFECLEALRLPLIKKEGYEADDIIGTLAKNAESNGHEVIISSGDKDFAQLISDKVKQFIPQKNNTEIIVDAKGVLKKFGVLPSQIIDFLALTGDTSDNVPGVPGCGPKTASEWLSRFGDLDNIVKNASEITGRGSKNLPGSLDWLATAKKLVTIKTDIPLDIKFEDLERKQPNFPQIKKLYEKYELRSLQKKLQSEINKELPSGTPKLAAQNKNQIQRSYEIVDDKEKLKAWINILNNSEIAAIDTETTGLNPKIANLVGISISTSPHKGAYIPVGHHADNCNNQLKLSTVLESLKPWLENDQKLKVGQNIKFDMHVLAKYGIKIRGVSHDTLLASYVLASHKSHKLDSLAKEHLGVDTIKFDDIVGKGRAQKQFSQVPIPQATEYSCEDADLTLQLHSILYQQLKSKSRLHNIYTEIEMPLLDVLFTMEKNGVLIDSNRLVNQSKEIADNLKKIKNDVHLMTGTEFNLSSTKQLREVLFEKQGLPVLKKTPGGEASTDESVLQKLALDYPLAKRLLDYRSLSKLMTTYTEKLPKMVNASTGRIHTNYGQAVAVTGRISSSEPNLQNIPVKTREGRRIREAFIAPENSVILSADYSQIELRIMAHLSQDQSLRNAFNKNQDIHKHTASEMYGIPQNNVTREHRRLAKVINFGLIYGMGSFGLANQLDIDISEAKTYIERYFSRYPGVKKYMNDTKVQAGELGYVETVFGRRLYLPDIRSKGSRKKAAEREAINAPMQGTAADLIKMAMIRVHKWLKNKNLKTKMIMQVHDEIVLEVPNAELNLVRDNLVPLMTDIVGISVPLVIDIGQGVDWDKAH